MKKYTQEEFDNFEIINGIKQCPSGDYSLIKTFAECCSFAEGCSFAKSCSYNGNEFYSMMSIGYIGSVERTTYVYFTKSNGIRICCGCQGDISLDEFKNRIKEKHTGQFYHEYMAAVNLIEIKAKRYYKEQTSE